MKFQSKILWMIGVFAFVLTSGMMAWFNQYITSLETSNLEDVLQTYTQNISQQVNSVFYNMDCTALQISANPRVMSIFQSMPEESATNYFDYHPQLAQEMTNLISSLNFLRNIHLRVCLMNAYGDFVYAGIRDTDTESLKDFYASGTVAQWNDYFSTAGRYSLFLPPHTDPYKKSAASDPSEEILSVIRPIKNLHGQIGQEILGYVEVQKKVADIDGLFTTIPQFTSVYLLSADGALLRSYQGDEALEGVVSAAYAGAAEGSDGCRHIGRCLTSVSPLKQIGLTLVTVSQYTKSSIFSIWKIMLVVVLLILCLFCTAQGLLVRMFTRPLKQLHRSIKDLSINNLSIKVNESDELKEIETAFNETIRQLEVSMQEKVELKTRELQSFLLALQSQMDPHFMHNSLAIIMMEAEDQNYEAISAMCLGLSKMLRFTASYDETSNTMAQELDYTRSYLELMKIRYEDRLQYSLDYLPDALPLSVPKLIIQPLVENCFKHAFVSAPTPWQVTVHAWRDENRWFVSVADNGSGFDEKQLKHLQVLKDQFKLETLSSVLSSLHVNGMCLANIFVRLKLMYKDDLTFEVRNDPDAGATVTIGGRVQ